MVISLEQREAYSEVLEVLRHMDKIYVNMIPKKIIMFFYDNCSLDYEFTMTKSIGEENLKEKTLDLLSLLNLNLSASIPFSITSNLFDDITFSPKRSIPADSEHAKNNPLYT